MQILQVLLKLSLTLSADKRIIRLPFLGTRLATSLCRSEPNGAVATFLLANLMAGGREQLRNNAHLSQTTGYLKWHSVVKEENYLRGIYALLVNNRLFLAEAWCLQY